MIKVCEYFHREKIVVSKVIFNLVEKGIFMTGSGILTYSNRNNFSRVMDRLHKVPRKALHLSAVECFQIKTEFLPQRTHIHLKALNMLLTSSIE